MFKLRYLPSARNDLRNIINYISDNLKAPKAAMDLIDDLMRKWILKTQMQEICGLTVNNE